MKEELKTVAGEWQSIDTAPKNGTRFTAKRGKLSRITWWGKASHVPLYGWCFGRVEDVDVWTPTHWQHRPPGSDKEAAA